MVKPLVLLVLLLPLAVFAETLEETKVKAEAGSAEAQFSLGLMYYAGEGVTQDYTKAFVWLSLAAGQGNNAAESRNIAVEKLSPTALAEAQKQAAKLQEEIESWRMKE